MAEHNYLTDTYDANTAILNECKVHIAEIVLPSEPASQFDSVEVIGRLLIGGINNILGTVSQLFEGQAYTYRFAKNSVCLFDTNYGSKIDPATEDISTIVTTLKTFVGSMSISTSTEVLFSFPLATIASIYVKNMHIDLESASEDEIEKYYATLCNLDESNLSDYEKEKIKEYLSWISSRNVYYDPIRVFADLNRDEHYEEEYVTLYEKIHPIEKEIVNSYISAHVKETNKSGSIERIKYQIYTSEYRYNLIASTQSGEMTNDVYDSTNPDHYGSRQHSAVCFIAGKYDYLYRDDVEYVKGKEEQYRKIIEKNVSKGDYKKIASSHEKLANYLSEINSHGCGYAALVNTIFNYYLRKEDEFRETFGYDMYDKYGDLNYDLLLVDIYTSRKKPAKHESLNTDNQDDFAGEFMINHDVSSSAADHVNITPENYYEYVLNGYQVIVQLTNCKDFEYTKQYDSKYHAYVMSCTPYDGNGDPEGHAMTITGVTDDGRFIVSSWGDKYILDSNLNVNVTYTIVRYYD